MSRPKLVSVVIPTRNGVETLGSVLEALFRQKTSFDVEVVVVDSGSTDGSLDLLQRHPVHLLEIEPGSFDHGDTRNLAIRKAQGDPLVLLTQDAIPAACDMLEYLVRPLQEQRVAGVYGRQVPRADCDVVTRRQLEGWLTGRPTPSLAFLDGLRLDELTPFEQLELCTFDNVCSALRRSAWETVPFPRTRFGEDVAWGRAVIDRGWAIAYEPRAVVSHSHRRSVLYEYERTRMCHEALHELFGLATVPRARDVVRASLTNLRQDLPYVWRHAPTGRERWRQLARVSVLSVVSPLAQHLGSQGSARRNGG